MIVPVRQKAALCQFDKVWSKHKTGTFTNNKNATTCLMDYALSKIQEKIKHEYRSPGGALVN